jgi:hypothetical protein
MRCAESASSVIERLRRPTRRNTSATVRFTNEATTEIARPRPTCSIGCGANRRGKAVAMMLSAATRISAPSTPLEKYSAFSCP